MKCCLLLLALVVAANAAALYGVGRYSDDYNYGRFGGLGPNRLGGYGDGYGFGKGYGYGGYGGGYNGGYYGGRDRFPRRGGLFGGFHNFNGPYNGKYNGVCERDGFYVKDYDSFYICSNGVAHVQRCAPGSRNSNNNYSYGQHYKYSDFCDVNLNDHRLGNKYAKY